MKTFLHSGDLGDIIYSLPTIRGLGGGVLYLDPDGGLKDFFIQTKHIEKRTRLTKQSIDFVSPIIKLQPYITDIKIWSGEKVDYNLNSFRYIFSSKIRRNKNGNLADLHLQTFNLPFSEVTKPWLSVPESIRLDRKVIVSRSPRVQGGYGYLNMHKKTLAKEAIFVGLPKEHEFFEWTFDIKIPYRKTETVLELASIIKGSEKFIGNSSFPLSLAIGMHHKNIYQEVDLKIPTTVFENIKMHYF